MTDYCIESQVAERQLRRNDRWGGVLRSRGLISEDVELHTLAAKQYRYIKSPMLDQLYEQLTRDLSIGNRGKRDHRLAVFSLINACFESYYNIREDAEVGVLWPTSTSAAPANRYRRKLFSPNARRTAAEFLQGKGYVHFCKGGKNPSSFGPGLTSLVYPTEKLMRLYDQCLSANDYEVHDAEWLTEERIVLKDEHDRLKDYTDSEAIIRQRTVLQDMTDLNRSVVWTYHHQDVERTITPSSLSLVRQFHNGSFSEYGRIHCDAQGLRKASRRSLTISGADTVELDFKSMSATLAYAYVGMNDDLEPLVLEGDAYEVEGLSRPIAKAVFQICLNSSSYESAVKAVRSRYPEALIGARSMVSLVELKHRKIRNAFYRGLWMTKLSIMESDIMMSVLYHAAFFEVPVLPVHDGVVCRRTNKDMVCKFMQQAFERICGVTPRIALVEDSSGREVII